MGLVSIQIIKGAGDRPLDPIRDELISEEWVAVLRGRSELWEAYYGKTLRTISIPFRGFKLGDLVRVVTTTFRGVFIVRGINVSLEDESGRAIETLNLEGNHVDPDE